MNQPTLRRSGARKPAPWTSQVLLLAFVYWIVARFGLGLAEYQENATLIWAPTGIALGALILFGWRLWPGVLAGAALLNLSSPFEQSLLVSLGIGIGNTLEAVIGATLLERVDFRPKLERGRDAAALSNCPRRPTIRIPSADDDFRPA